MLIQNRLPFILLLVVFGIAPGRLATAQAGTTDPDEFSWPDGARAAVSLSFDDGRLSQVDVGAPLFERFGEIKATFYVVPDAVNERLDGWRRMVAAGHEIGNHSVRHPCSGNFAWARDKALERYTLAEMRSELSEANRRIEDLLGVQPVSFAYPCGQTFVGRGRDTRSYVPLVAELFDSGRGWLDEGPNDPIFVDFAQLTGMEMDGKDFEEIRTLIEQAKTSGAWLILAGHEIGEDGPQTTRVDMLEQLLDYASNPENGIWMAPVGAIAQYVGQRRSALGDRVETSSER